MKLLVLIALALETVLLGQTWQTHNDPSGFSVNLPPGWRAQPQGRGQALIESADGSRFVQVIPVLDLDTPCSQFLPQTFSAPSRRFPGARVARVSESQGGAAVAEIGFSQGAGKAAVLCSPTGRRSAMLYAVAAPAASYAVERSALLGILRSFRYSAATGRAGAGSRQLPPMTPWVEPTEGAWTMRVPKGWQADGRVVRHSNLAISAGMRITSPDRRTTFLIGDYRLRTCLTPNVSRTPVPMGGEAGYGGAIWLPLLSGPQFTQRYLSQWLQETGVRLARVEREATRPDLEAQANRNFMLTNANPSGAPRLSVGEVAFTGTQGEAGYLMGSTLANPAGFPNAYLWTSNVFGYIAPQSRMADDLAVLAAILPSIQANQQWADSSRDAGFRDSQIFRQAQNQQGDILTQTYWATQARTGAAMERDADARRDRVRLRDGAGYEYEARSGSNYYAILPTTGAIVGSDTGYFPPQIDLQPLEMIR